MTRGVASGGAVALGLAACALVVVAPLPYWWPVLTDGPLTLPGEVVLVLLMGWGVVSLLGVGLGLVGVPVSVAAAAWALWPAPRWAPATAAVGGALLSGLAVVGGVHSAAAWAMAVGLGAAVWAAGGA